MERSESAQLKKFHDLPIGAYYHHIGSPSDRVFQKISSREGKAVPRQFILNTALVYEIEE